MNFKYHSCQTQILPIPSRRICDNGTIFRFRSRLLFSDQSEVKYSNIFMSQRMECDSLISKASTASSRRYNNHIVLTHNERIWTCTARRACKLLLLGEVYWEQFVHLVAVRFMKFKHSNHHQAVFPFAASILQDAHLSVTHQDPYVAWVIEHLTCLFIVKIAWRFPEIGLLQLRLLLILLFITLLTFKMNYWSMKEIIQRNDCSTLNENVSLQLS